MAHSHGQAGHQACNQPILHSIVPMGLVTVIHPSEDEVHGALLDRTSVLSAGQTWLCH